MAVASVIDNDGIASLEFVATVPEMRRRGFAREVCEKAICDAFMDGAKIVTVRAINAVTGILQGIKDDTVREMLLKQMKALV